MTTPQQDPVREALDLVESVLRGYPVGHARSEALAAVKTVRAALPVQSAEPATPARHQAGGAVRDELDLIEAVLKGYPASTARTDAIRAVRNVTAALTHAADHIADISKMVETPAAADAGRKLYEAHLAELDKTFNTNRCPAWSELSASEKARWNADAAPAAVQYTYTSTQATNCAVCGERKHTPLRVDSMGGYVCLTCIDKKLGSLLGEFGYPAAGQGEALTDEQIDALLAREIGFDGGLQTVNATDLRRVVRAALAASAPAPQAAPVVSEGWKLLKDSTHAERSKPGEYSCTCVHCLRTFTSHKRDGLCAVCAAAPDAKGGV